MPKPKDFTEKEEKERKKLAEKLKRKRGIKNPWALATYIIRKKKKK